MNLRSLALAGIIGLATLTGCTSDQYSNNGGGYQQHENSPFWSSLLGAGVGSYVGGRLANHHSYGGGYHPYYHHTTVINHYHTSYHTSYHSHR